MLIYFYHLQWLPRIHRAGGDRIWCEKGKRFANEFLFDDSGKVIALIKKNPLSAKTEKPSN